MQQNSISFDNYRKARMKKKKLKKFNIEWIGINSLEFNINTRYLILTKVLVVLHNIGNE